MSHDISIIATITVGLVLAFFGGLLAYKLRLPPLVGYGTAGNSCQRNIVAVLVVDCSKERIYSPETY